MALDFLILYEHVVREYESLLLLQAESESARVPASTPLSTREKIPFFFMGNRSFRGVGWVFCFNRGRCLVVQ